MVGEMQGDNQRDIAVSIRLMSKALLLMMASFQQELSYCFPNCTFFPSRCKRLLQMGCERQAAWFLRMHMLEIRMTMIGRPTSFSPTSTTMGASTRRGSWGASDGSLLCSLLGVPWSSNQCTKGTSGYHINFTYEHVCCSDYWKGAMPYFSSSLDYVESIHCKFIFQFILPWIVFFHQLYCCMFQFHVFPASCTTRRRSPLGLGPWFLRRLEAIQGCSDA